MYRVKQIDAEYDLAGFSRWLRSQGIEHRVTEEGGAQVLWLQDPEHSEPVLTALERYLNEPALRQRVDEVASSPVFVRGRWQPSPSHAPLVLGLIGFAILAALFTDLGQNPRSALLMMTDPRVYDWGSLAERTQALLATLEMGQVWRLLTPDFLHFSWTHLVFNAVMLWFLGSQIEWFDGRQRMLVLFILISLASNGFQYLMIGPLFGGLSGVVYGTLGYCWLSQRRRARFQFPPALVTFAVVWMILGFTPVPELLGLGRMANEAHLGGFLAGLVLALILPVRKKAPQQGGA